MARGMGFPSYFQSDTLSRPECELVVELLRREYTAQAQVGDMQDYELAALRRRIDGILDKLGCAPIED